MALKLGYLLPTRENIMQNRPAGRLLMDAAKQAQSQGVDSIWAGDSLLARPRHDPLTLLAAVAGAIPHIQLGTAVLLPALRNPIVLAQQLATIDQVSEGRLIVGAGIAADTPSIRAEFEAAGVPFEKRVGRMMEGFRLCKALWKGEALDWDGRWKISQGQLAPTPYTPGGPPIWIGTGATAGIERTAKNFDGWFPVGPDVARFAQRRNLFRQAAVDAGRDPNSLTTAIYVTVAITNDMASGDAAIDTYMQSYYGAPPAIMRKMQACFGGPLEQVLGFIRAYVEAGAEHVVIRVVGDHTTTVKQLCAHRDELVG